jgi:hypothetical protein
MDFSYYRPTDVELWINNAYQRNGINYASDLDIERIAALFNIEIEFYHGRPFVHYDDYEFATIFLDADASLLDQREAFFHELCHPTRHTGCQMRMPALFKELQEIQAAHFQMYAAMPAYLVESLVVGNVSVKVLADEFQLNESFIIRRLQQIKNRIEDGKWLEGTKRKYRFPREIPIEKDHIRQVFFELRRIQQRRRANNVYLTRE